jgi:hypothetical protein
MKLKNLCLTGLSIVLFPNCSLNKLEQKRLLARVTTTEDRLEILNLLAGSSGFSIYQVHTLIWV